MSAIEGGLSSSHHFIVFSGLEKGGLNKKICEEKSLAVVPLRMPSKSFAKRPYFNISVTYLFAAFHQNHQLDLGRVADNVIPASCSDDQPIRSQAMSCASGGHATSQYRTPPPLSLCIYKLQDSPRPRRTPQPLSSPSEDSPRPRRTPQPLPKTPLAPGGLPSSLRGLPSTQEDSPTPFEDPPRIRRTPQPLSKTPLASGGPPSPFRGLASSASCSRPLSSTPCRRCGQSPVDLGTDQPVPRPPPHLRLCLDSCDRFNHMRVMPSWGSSTELLRARVPANSAA